MFKLRPFFFEANWPLAPFCGHLTSRADSEDIFADGRWLNNILLKAPYGRRLSVEFICNLLPESAQSRGYAIRFWRSNVRSSCSLKAGM